MAEKITDICTECGEETEVIIVDDETRLCEDCLAELDFIECDHCHEYWQADVVEFYETEDGSTICEHCKDMLDEDAED
jgi:hypothetical protein